MTLQEIIDAAKETDIPFDEIDVTAGRGVARFSISVDVRSDRRMRGTITLDPIKLVHDAVAHGIMANPLGISMSVKPVCEACEEEGRNGG